MKSGIQTKLNPILEKNSVALAYVFGSVAKGKEGPLSDFDVAIVFDKDVPTKGYFDRETNIGLGIGRALSVSRVDVVNLQTARSPVLKHRAVFYGEPIFVKDKKLQFYIEKRILEEFEDTKYLRSVTGAILERQIREGKIGNAPLSPKEEMSFSRYVHR
jgi:predicted nucleotidyltransferase